MKSKKPKAVPAVAPEEPETLESPLAAGGQLWPTEEEIAGWDPFQRILLGAELYNNCDHIPPREELERVKERTRRVHLEALARVKQLTQWLAGSLEKLRWVAGSAVSPKVQKIAQEALADHYVEIGKEYARARQKKAGGRLHSYLAGLLTKPAFRERFEYRKSIQNHERDAVRPPMLVVVDAIQTEIAMHANMTLALGMGKGTDEDRDSIWEKTVVPTIKIRWNQLRARYLSAEKRQTFDSWEKRLRDSFHALWVERKTRTENEPDFSFGPSNLRVSATVALEIFRRTLSEIGEQKE